LIDIRSIGASISDCIVVVDLEGRLTYGNPRVYEVTGIDPGLNVGKPIGEVLSTDGKDEIGQLIRGLFSTGRPVRAEVELDSTSGGRLFVELNASAIQDSDGRVAGAVAAFREISGRKAWAEELQARNRELKLLNAISASINRSQDLKDMFFSVLNDVIDLLKAESGGIYMVDSSPPGQMKLWAALPYASAGTVERFRQTYTPSMRVDAGRVHVSDERMSECVAAPAGSGRVVTVPITVKTRLSGLMVIRSGDVPGAPRPWEAETTAAQLLSIGSQLGIAIENQQLLARVTEASRHLSDIIEESPDAMLTTDVAGVVKSFNRSASRLLHYAQEEVLGKHISMLLPQGSDFKIEAGRSYVREFRRKGDTSVSLNISAAKLSRSDINDGYIITLKDLSGISGLMITPIFETAAEGDQEYHFDKGRMYLIDKSRTGGYMDIFVDQVRHNIQGLCITRLNPKAVRDRYGLEKTPVIWLNGGDVTYGETVIKPGNVSSLTATVSEFIARTGDGVVLLDGMEYLLARNGFDAVLKFAQHLNDRLMTSNSRAFFCIDAGALDDRQLHLLLTEMTEFRKTRADYKQTSITRYGGGG
jgi:PAS domain S-box-containing protein